MLNKQSVTTLSGIGEKVAKQLEKLHIYTIQDLLFHFPYRYQDRTRLVPIHTLRVGDTVVVEATIIKKELTQGRRKYLTVWIQDASGIMQLKFFNFNHGMLRVFEAQKRIRAFGEVRRGFPYLEMVHPEFRQLDEDIPVEECLTPIYPLTSGLSQKQMRGFIAKALEKLTQDAFPSFIKENVSLSDAIHYLHNPPPDANLQALSEGAHPYQKALALEEVLAYQLALMRAKALEATKPSYQLKLHEPTKQTFLKALPFELTNAQMRVITEIEADLEKTHPMMRLVQGDVGSGKTVVAAVALLHAAHNGLQSIMIAPTELLAEQHFLTLSRWFEPLGISCVFISGRLTAKEKRERAKRIQEGLASVTVGTHATFQESIIYKNLALIIVDEQHRFGVEQRLALQEKNETFHPHFLMMTATPIPRTLAMIAYADLKHSVIDERPKNRIPITTTLVAHHKQDRVIERLGVQCQKGTQAYWVCTLIESSETLTAEAAEERYQYLKDALPTLTIGLLHGKLKSKEKEHLMQAFKAHEIDILVATTVIEVGVDVPNATIMVIENAERLGLFQLHQLRGRVGRGSAASFCLLMYEAPLTHIAEERLKILQHTDNGFVIAEKDLELRGAGEIIGTKQTGEVSFKVLNIIQHQSVITEAQKLIPHYLDNEQVIDALISRWLSNRAQFVRV